ncbi:MAG: amidophosphoribosyltransferase [Elusimicrobiota bacterium]|jgi:amidophosphoribosyltransferase|nr:amidophosphoribosyltransferase [Elusimicrobiota bacterium]
MLEHDKMQEECGVFGIFNHPEATHMTYLGLYALQHRGQESAGIAVSDRTRIKNYKKMGLVSDIFKERILNGLTGNIAIGHVRYSTSGSSIERNAQPFSVYYSKGPIAISHNGNIINAFELREQLEEKGAIFQTTLDSEIIIHLLAKNTKKNFIQSIIDSLNLLKGSYALLIMSRDNLIAARDPWGFRPLVLGKVGGKYVVSSETCAFDLINAEYIREIEPGELIMIDDNGVTSYYFNKNEAHRCCIFEYVYFARPDSIVFGKSVQSVRKELGIQLAKEAPVDADIVIPVPDSGIYAGFGYSDESKIPLEMGFVRNHYVGRTFIKPTQDDRSFGVRVKLNPVKEIIKNKRIILIDDSIVRATTTKMRIEALKNCGAKKIHLRIVSPPITDSCFFGIDTPDKEKLIASSHSVKEIEKILGVDSLAYISTEGLLNSVNNKHKYCLSCFDGKYPFEVNPEKARFRLENSTQIDFKF